MSERPETHPNPALTVGPDNLQGWNRPAQRRHGFHNLHTLFRKALMLRARNVLTLHDVPDQAVAACVARARLTRHPAFSALVVAQGNQVLHARAAPDFALDRPHSIQSVTKMHIHLVAGRLIADGLLDPGLPAGDYLPWLGSGYAGASVGDLLDMAVRNDFNEDYADPDADCYREELSLGWRLNADGSPEPSLRDFLAGISGDCARHDGAAAHYKSANTDVLTMICASLCDLTAMLADIVDAAGYEGAFHVSLSPEGMPALSGGGCLSALDLARLGLLMARAGLGGDGSAVGDAGFLRESLDRPALSLAPRRPWQRYSRHLMVGAGMFGHSGYGGQYLMVNPANGRVAAYLSVLENRSGYDTQYMRDVARALEGMLAA
ncbi:MAG: beta-lactamase family protein [Rhodobacteraceae bacterium]|nr:beta-lactamase family protein [Paracoccaceae bacterium]